MRVHHVKSARKAKSVRRCISCGHEVERFESYKYAEPRYGGKLIWCYKCTPRRSQMTSSKLSAVYAAQEDAEKSLDQVETPEDVTSTLEECASAAREVAEEYRESIYAMPEQLQETSATAEDMNYKIDELEQWADNLESFDSDPDSYESFAELVSAAQEMLQELPV